MARVEWPGMPEGYWPDTERPWRIAFGIGSFRDYATREAAEADRPRILALANDDEAWWRKSVTEPFNAVELTGAR